MKPQRSQHLQNQDLSTNTNSILFDIRGEPVAYFTQDRPFKIENFLCEASLQSEGVLRLCTYVVTDTRAETRKQVIHNLVNELSQRKEDFVAIEKDISSLMVKIQDCGEDAEELGLEMTRMLMLKGQHKKRICELQNQTKLSVTYRQIRKVRSSLLPSGIFVKVPWLAKPVMWCSNIKEKIEEKAKMITEEMPNYALEENEVAKGHLYVVGGFDGSYLLSVERYNPDQNQWTAISKMNSRRHGPGVATLGGQLYVMGGWDGSSSSNDVERYCPHQNRWTAMMEMTSKRAQFGAAILDGQLYAVGGYGTSSCLSSAERYDPEKKQWTAIAPMSTNRYTHGVAVVGGQLYAVGGSDGLSPLSSVERYDPELQKWVPVVSMSSKRQELGVSVVGGHLYAMGGYNGSYGLSSVERYDPDEDKWTTVADMNCRRYALSAAVVGGQLYAIGGINCIYSRCRAGVGGQFQCGARFRRSPTCKLSSVERYEPKRNKWTTIASMNYVRESAGVVVISV